MSKTVLYLRFGGRVEALAALAAVLGHGPEADDDGEVYPSTGTHAGTRYDLCWLVDAGVIAAGGAELVNLLWWGEAATAPDFGAAAVVPATPSCLFLGG